jgi:hypothetical protein
VKRLGQEPIDVYCFLTEQFRSKPVTSNYVFQFVFRSYYRLDNAGLTESFRREYFSQMELARTTGEVDIPELIRRLEAFPTRKGKSSQQVSFSTKLAHTINPKYPIYDAEVKNVFSLKGPDYKKRPQQRAADFMASYRNLTSIYDDILKQNLLAKPLKSFRDEYHCDADIVPDTKALDFIFWSAGKLKIRAPEVRQPRPAND